MKKTKKKSIVKAAAKTSAKKTGKAPAKAKVKGKPKAKPSKKKPPSAVSKKHKKGKSVPCEFCGKPIPEERLEILPDTTTCVECSQTQPYSKAEIIGFNLGENTEKEGIDMEDFDH